MGFNYNKRTAEHFAKHPLLVGAAPLSDVPETSNQGVGMNITCADGKVFGPTEAKCVGSVSKVNSREVHKPAQIGEFPVLVEQSGNYRLFTYSSKIKSID